MNKLLEPKPARYAQGRPERIADDFYNTESKLDELIADDAVDKLTQPLYRLKQIIGTVNVIRMTTEHAQTRLDMEHILRVAGVTIDGD
jgi:hypothetical protein